MAQRYIYAVGRVRAGAPRVSPMGIQMRAPAIIDHGTEEQKAFYLPRMLSGEHFWSQGYSEPGAGSDLAALQMRLDSIEEAAREAPGDGADRDREAGGL